MKVGKGLYRSPLAEAALILYYMCKCHLPIRMFLRLNTDGRYFVTNSKIRMRVFCLFCRVDIHSLIFFSDSVRLQFMFHGQNKEPHPFHVKSSWELPIKPSVALEAYLEWSKTQLLAGVKIFKPKTDFPHRKRQAIKEIEQNTNISVKRANKWTTTVIMNKEDKKETRGTGATAPKRKL